MKRKNYLLLSFIPLLTSCANYEENLFSVTFLSGDIKNTYYESSNVNVEIYGNYLLSFNIPKRIEVNESNKDKLIDFYYKEDKISISFDYNTYYNKIYYNFQTKNLFNDELLIITFENIKYEFKINSVKPSLNNILNINNLSLNYKEFKEMMDSITYYAYKDEYIGLNSYGSSYYLGNFFDYSFSKTYDLDYVKYLKDDCYYPSLFDNASPNIVYFDFQMRFDDECDISKNSLKHTMCSYRVSLGVIDPGCTNPSNPLRYMSFEAIPLNYTSKIKNINESNEEKLNEHYYLLSKNYSDLFLDYKVNDLNIKLISTSNNDIYGFFEDDTYSYRISASYER